MNTLKIKKGDRIIVIAGDSKDKGKKAKVLLANPEKNTVIVEGINIQKRHKKAKSAKQAGGIISQPGPVDVSNVMMLCPVCGKPTRVGYNFDPKGNKFRICKHSGCNANLDTKAKEKASKKEVKAEKKADEKVAKPKKAKKEKSEE